MESWQRPCSPDDLVELAYLGLNLVFGGRVAPVELLDCARDAMDRKAFYRDQWVAGREFTDVRLSENQVARLRSVVDENHGVVICTFQIGPFLQLPFMLSKMSLPVMLLMDPENFQYGMDICAVTGIGPGSVPQGLWPKTDTPDPQAQPVTFISSGDQSTAWRMAQWIKSGKVLFAYMDGNRGLETGYNEKSSVIVNFFGSEIWVRKGLAYLAGFSGAPLMFMITRKRGDDHVVHLTAPVRKRKEESLDAFAQRGVRAGYRLLEEHIRQDVACWNEWGQLHRWAARLRKQQGPEQAAVAADKALEQGLKLEPQVVQLRFGEQDVLVNQKTGAALLFTPAIADVVRLAEQGSSVQSILDQLSSSYDEQTLLEVIQALAKDAFLQVSG